MHQESIDRNEIQLPPKMKSSTAWGLMHQLFLESFDTIDGHEQLASY